MCDPDVCPGVRGRRILEPHVVVIHKTETGKCYLFFAKTVYDAKTDTFFNLLMRNLLTGPHQGIVCKKKTSYDTIVV